MEPGCFDVRPKSLDQTEAVTAVELEQLPPWYFGLCLASRALRQHFGLRPWIPDGLVQVHTMKGDQFPEIFGHSKIQENWPQSTEGSRMV